ncbi:MAG: ion transporter, partial [Rothia mucilaginosa]|nr:ion transporter [Rothia mucilaginosa]
MDKAEQNQTDNTVKNGTAPNTSGNTSGNIPGNSPVGASARPETVASETTASEAAAENTTKAGYTQSAPAESSAAKTSAAASSPAESTALHVDAVQIDSARLDSAHAVYSTDLDPDDDYEEVVEEYATTDAPDGTHREERRITRTTHHPRGKGDQKAGTPNTGSPKAGTQGNPDDAAEIIDAGEPETHTTTIRTVTRTVTDPP